MAARYRGLQPLDAIAVGLEAVCGAIVRAVLLLKQHQYRRRYNALLICICLVATTHHFQRCSLSNSKLARKTAAYWLSYVNEKLITYSSYVSAGSFA